MPQNITDSITYTSPVVSVADGDAASGANFLTAPQGLANRTAFLNNILGTTGVTLIRSGTAAAMQALTGVVNGSVFLLNGGTSVLQGIYVYQSGSGLTPDNAWVYAATGMGVGNWVHELFAVVNNNPGIASIGLVPGQTGTQSGKVKVAVVPNCIVATLELHSAGLSFSTTSTSYVDVTGYTLSVPNCVAGDKIFLNWYASVYMDAAAHFGKFGATVVDGASTTQLVEYAINGNIGLVNTAQVFSIPYLYTVVNSGTLTVKGMLLSNNVAWTSTIVGNAGTGGMATITALQMRP